VLDFRGLGGDSWRAVVAEVWGDGRAVWVVMGWSFWRCADAFVLGRLCVRGMRLLQRAEVLQWARILENHEL
jgi:hypothetical protein